MTSYSAEQIKDVILSCLTCVEFTYHGKDCNIDPFPPRSFHLYCDGEECDVETIEDVMNTPFFDGRCLAEIAGGITDFSW